MPLVVFSVIVPLQGYLSAFYAIGVLVVLATPVKTTSWIPTHTLPSYTIAMLMVLTTVVKNYLKWLAIQLATHSIVGD